MPANSASGTSTSGSANQWSCGWPELSLDTHRIVAMTSPPVHALRNAAAVLLDLLAPPLCWSCAAPAVRGAGLCAACRRSLRFLGGGPALLCGLAVWAPVAYDGPARELVKALKFHAATGIADEMAALVVANAPPRLLTAPLVPVPLHPARRRIRPFNQAELLARAISARAARTGPALPIRDCLA